MNDQPPAMMRKILRRLGAISFVTALLIGGAAAAQQTGKPVPRPAARPTPSLADIGPVEGRGNWEVHPDNPAFPRRGPRLADAPPGNKQWRAHLVPHADKSVTGDIGVDLGNQQVIKHGNVHARYDRGRLWGEIFDDDDKQAATFEAVLGESGVQGRYTTRDDDTGTFTWEGVLPTLPTPAP